MRNSTWYLQGTSHKPGAFCGTVSKLPHKPRKLDCMSGFYRDVQLCPRTVGQLVWSRDKNEGVSNPLSGSPGKSIMKIRAAWSSYFDEGVGTAACFAPRTG